MFLLNNTKKQQSRKTITKTQVKSKDASKSGTIFLLSKQSGKVSMDQAQTVKFCLRKLLKKQAKVWSFTLNYHNVTKKANENRLGKGKGNIKYKAIAIRSGNALNSVKLLKTSSGVIETVEKIKSLASVSTVLRVKNERWIL